MKPNESHDLQYWIDKYEIEAEKYDLLSGFAVYFEPNKGFFHWCVFHDIFEINHTCTDNGKYMFEIANKMAKDRNCKLLRTATKRNPSAYMRLMKCTPNVLLSGIRPNGEFYWVMDKKVE